MDREEEVLSFLEALANGIYQTPQEIIITIIIILSFILFLIVYYLLQQRKIRRQTAKRSQELYDEAVQGLDLSPSDESLIEEMSQFLKEPVKKYLIITNQVTFNACASQLLEKTAVPEESISALRVKLGFNRRTENKMPRSTADLPPGASVLLKNNKGKTLKAKILPPKTEAFRLMSRDAAQGFTSGTPVSIYYPHHSGIIRFNSHISNYSNGLMQLSHSEEPQRFQRREYYRQKVSFPAYIKQAGKDSEPVKGRFIDISEGGANIEVPERMFAHVGNTVEISFHPDSEDNLSLLGSVVRISHKGRRLHVKFRNIREKTRSKIMRTVFSGSRKSRQNS